MASKIFRPAGDARSDSGSLSKQIFILQNAALFSKTVHSRDRAAFLCVLSAPTFTLNVGSADKVAKDQGVAAFKKNAEWNWALEANNCWSMLLGSDLHSSLNLLSTKAPLFVDEDIKNDGLSMKTRVFVDRLSYMGYAWGCFVISGSQLFLSNLPYQTICRFMRRFCNCFCGSSAKQILFFVFAVLLSSSTSYAMWENNPLKKTLNINKGLSDDTVNDVLSDSKGFIWAATYKGLDRYDGHHLKHISLNDPHCLYEDADGNIVSSRVGMLTKEALESELKKLTE